MRTTLFCGVAIVVTAVPELVAAQAPPALSETVPPETTQSPDTPAPSLDRPLMLAQRSQPTTANAGNQLEEIVVTARRREEVLQDVPVAITAISGSELDDRHLVDTADLRELSPSLNVSGQLRDDAQFFIRGQGPGVINAGQHNFTSVATYFDEVPTLISGPGVFFDLANVQVLKGPQGTLFGRNTTGGAVLFTPAKPTQDFEGDVKLTAGNYADREAEAFVNLPLIDNILSLRVAGDFAKRGGFTQNVITGQYLDDRDFSSWRVSLRWTPIDGLDNTLVFDGRNINQNGSSAILRAVNPNAVLSPNFWSSFPAPLNALPAVPLTIGGNGPSVAAFSTTPPAQIPALIGQALAAGRVSYFPNPALQGVLAEQQALGIRQEAFPEVLHDEQRALGLINTTVWDVTDDVTLKNILGFRRNRVKEDNDYDGTVLPLLAQVTPSGDGWNTALDQYTEEFQIQRRGNLINWITGLYYEYSQPGTQQVFEGNTLGVDSLRYPSFRDSSSAVFAHLDVNLSDVHSGLSISGGARYTHDEREASVTQIDNTGQCTPAEGGCSFSKDFGAATWDFSIQQKLNDDTMTYVAVRKGYKSGGFNLPAPAPDEAAFGPETVTDLEVGLKSDWKIGSMPVRTNLDVYRDWYRNIQLIQAVATPGVGIQSLITNAASAKIYGFEGELTLIPVRSLELTAFYSYTRAIYGNLFYDDTNVTGTQFDFVPMNKAGGTARYTISMGTAGALVLGADGTYQSVANSPDRTAPSPINKVPSYALLNLHLDWNGVLGLPLDIGFFGTNMTNREYIVGGYPLYSSLGFTSALYGEPRMYGASVRYRFGKQR
jgi:iron complex outermembrane receptor protein